MSPARLYRVGLVLLILAGLLTAALVQGSLNRDRVALGVTRGEVLGKAAPPALVFTTVALGGFRGLIANALWIRAMDLQEQDKFFEKVQLADWITKLQPRFVTVWIVQAWDMAYNISVKFSSPADRWLWVKRGIELLRDEAIQYNPDETLLYRELAWFFQHKMGADLDDAHFYYKTNWIHEMEVVLDGTNYVALIQPETEDEIERARILRERYKLDPAIMLEIDESYGPLEWRLPEAHAVYWATVGFKRSREEELMTLRRTIYQPLQLAFRRGRIMEFPTPTGTHYRFLPNVEMIPKANQSYLDMATDDPANEQHILRAHRNFLKDAIYFLYVANRRSEAQQWWDYLLEHYPDASWGDYRKMDRSQTRFADVTLEDYAAAKVTEDIGETSRDRVTANILGLLTTSYFYLSYDKDDEAVSHKRLAQLAWNRFQRETKGIKQQQRIGLDPFPDMEREAREYFRQTYHPELVARLYSRLGLPLPQAPPAEPVPSTSTPGSTNSTPQSP